MRRPVSGRQATASRRQRRRVSRAASPGEPVRRAAGARQHPPPPPVRRLGDCRADVLRHRPRFAHGLEGVEVDVLAGTGAAAGRPPVSWPDSPLRPTRRRASAGRQGARTGCHPRSMPLRRRREIGPRVDRSQTRQGRDLHGRRPVQVHGHHATDDEVTDAAAVGGPERMRASIRPGRNVAAVSPMARRRSFVVVDVPSLARPTR